MTRLNVSVPELFRLWNSSMPNADLCKALGVGRSTLYILRMRYKLPRRKTEREDPQSREENCPSEDEIVERAAQIRAGWPEGEEERRMVGPRARRWRIPSYSFQPREHSFSEISGH